MQPVGPEHQIDLAASLGQRFIEFAHGESPQRKSLFEVSARDTTCQVHVHFDRWIALAVGVGFGEAWAEIQSWLTGACQCMGTLGVRP